MCRYYCSRLGLEKAKQMTFVSCMAAWRKGGDTTAESDAELVANFAEQEAEDDLIDIEQEPEKLVCSRQPLTSAMHNNCRM